MGLALDQSAQMDDDALSFIALACNLVVVADQFCELFLVLLALAFEVFGDFLLHHERLKSLVALLFGTREAHGEHVVVGLLLFDEFVKTRILLLVALDLGLEILCLLCELRCKRLELLEL